MRQSKCLLAHAAFLRLRALLPAQPHHCHLQLHHEQLNLALLNELAQGLHYPILRELLTAKHQTFGRQVADSPIEHFEGEEFLDQGVIFKEGSLESGNHVVLVDESSLAREVLVDDCNNSEDVFSAITLLEQVVVYAEDSEQEFAGEGKIEFRVFSYELSNDRKHVQHTKFDALILRLVLSKQGKKYLELAPQTSKMIHHFTHQIHVGHEHSSVTLLEEPTHALKAFLELLPLCHSHLLCQLMHRLGSFRFVSSNFDGLEEKLQRRFLQDDGGVRGLRLSRT